MTDAEWLTLVLAIVYLIECTNIVPAQALVIKSQGPKKGRLLRPLLVLPGIDRAVVVSNPLNLRSQDLLVVNSSVVIVGGRAIVIDNIGGRFHKVTPVSTSSGDSFNRSPDNIIGDHLTARQWIGAQIHALERRSRPNDVFEALRLDRRSARRLQQIRNVLERRLTLLTILGITQGVALLVVFPVMMFWQGILPALINLAPIVIAVQVLICIELFGLRRRYFRESIAMAITQLVPVLLFPIGAIRSAVNFARNITQGYHPVLAGVSLISANLATHELARYGRWLVYGLNKARVDSASTERDCVTIQDWRRRELHDLEHYLRTEGTTIRQLLALSHPSKSDARFCPLCLAEYDDSFSQCSECGDVNLRRVYCVKE